MLHSLKHKILCVNQFIYAIGIYTVWRPSKKIVACIDLISSLSTNEARCYTFPQNNEAIFDRAED